MADLSYDDTAEILDRLGSIAEDIVLIGGQAVHFWVAYYEDRIPNVAAGAPLTSKDVDFCGDARQAEAAAVALGGSVKLRQSFDDVTPNTGLVSFVHAGEPQEIDFIDQPFGIPAADVERMAVPVRTSADGVRFRVLSPLLCMESRVCNTSLADVYCSPHALRQLRASILCAREFLIDAVAHDGPKPFCKACERVFTFARGRREAKKVFDVHGIDPLEAVPRGLDYDELANFYTLRLPQMDDILAADRSRRKRDREHRAAQAANKKSRER